MPHFPDFGWDTLQFQPGQTLRCMDLAVSFILQSKVYDFILTEPDGIQIGETDTMLVFVDKDLWTAPENFTSHPCSQTIMANFDFENFSELHLNSYFSQVTLPAGSPMEVCDPLPLIFWNSPGNSPGIMAEPGSSPSNNVAYMAGNVVDNFVIINGDTVGRSNPESIFVPLCKPLLPGCDYTITFRYRRDNPSAESGLIQIYGTNPYPCEIPFPADCDDPPSIGGYHCLEAGVEVDNDSWQTYTLSVTQTQLPEPVHFLVIANNTLVFGPAPPPPAVVGADIYVDDIEVTRVCNPFACACEEPGQPAVNIHSADYDGAIPLSQLVAQNILPAESAANYCIAVNGRLLADIDYSFFSSNFRMQPEADIIVNPGVELQFEDSDLSACHQMWKGVFVHNGGRLVMTGSKVSDAQYAVYVQSAPNSSSLPTDVLLNNNRFDNNFVGLYADGAVWGDLKVQSNHFLQSAADLLTPYSGQSSASENLPDQNQKSLAGIVVSDIGVLSSRFNTFEGLTSGIVSRRNAIVSWDDRFEEIRSHNSYYPDWEARGVGLSSYANGAQTVSVRRGYFEDCTAGIASFDARFTAIGNVMHDVQSGIFALSNFPTQAVLTENRIEDAQAGIVLAYTHLSGAVSLNENYVSTQADATGAGIRLLAGKAPTQLNANTVDVKKSGNGISALSTSRITLYDNTVNLEDPTLARSGIILEGVTQSLLETNTVLGSGATGAGNIALRIASSPGNVYCCNTLDNTRLGAYVTGGSLATDNFRGTHFSNHAISLLLPDVNAILGSQTHTQNCWGANAGAAVYGMDLSNPVPLVHAQEYPFTVDPNPEGNECFLPEEHAPMGWFEVITDSDPVNACDVEVCILDMFAPESDDVKRIAIGDTTTAPAVMWEMQRYIYERLQGETVQNASILAFLAQADTSSIGAFYTVSRGILELFTSDSIAAAQLRANLESAGEKLDSILWIDGLLAEADSMEAASLRSQRGILVDALFDLEEESLSLAEAISDYISDEAGKLLSQNDSIAVTEIYEINEKGVNDIYLHWLSTAFGALDSVEMAALTAIAEQCPFEGGNAVYRARAFLAALTQEFVSYNDSLLCAPTELLIIHSESGALLQTAKDEVELRIFPNPAQNEISITWGTSKEASGMLSVYDVFGRQVLQQVLGEGANTHTLNIRDLPDGLYFFRIRFQDWDAVRKIIVTR
ncbi:MAG: T9SS type A sorting domain-containing protein [Saprospiraceae bacterium]|nr:T9SS type A sorting domain-containing protein [Saprospiraceae bacterium]